MVRGSGTKGAYLAGIPLNGSPDIPLPTPVHYREPHIPFGRGGGGLWSWLDVGRPASVPVVTSSLEPKK
jgi:hypothetical protein